MRTIMAITFNADEIFEMAEEIESNGAKFYRQAAEKADDQVKKFLLDMAEMEVGHLATFKEIRKQLSEAEKGETVYDPNYESIQYLQTMANARGWEGRISPMEELTGQESIKEILEIALNSDKESVVFYFGLKGLVPVKAGRDKIEKIIMEELGHISTLLKQLKSIETN